MEEGDDDDDHDDDDHDDDDDDEAEAEGGRPSGRPHYAPRRSQEDPGGPGEAKGSGRQQEDTKGFAE
eukprot:1219821-Pyramimonas_sp.AAC.1